MPFVNEKIEATPATRAGGEALIRAFVPRMGLRYAKSRNFDHGPGAHSDVSTLSPFIRRRLVLERDVVAAAMGAHGFDNAEKFVQEVIWRGYFKGWLERRPAVWTSYVTGLDRDLAILDTDRRLRRDVAAAEAGQTGLECFDAWARELVETGYLHNHARMWFASIWIFTLGLPWRVGADFFYRHLLDGDPASNTLGWRWVAGLHTRGKPYAAQAWNIARFTGERFTPRAMTLPTTCRGGRTRSRRACPPWPRCASRLVPDADIPTALLLTEEDCRVEDFMPDALDIRAAGALAASHLRSPREVSDRVAHFEAAALADAADRTGAAVERLRAEAPGDLAAWAARSGARQVATPYVPAGPLRDWLDAAQPALEEAGIVLSEWRRDWDAAIWPHATAGFFKVKKQIPRILHEVGLT